MTQRKRNRKSMDEVAQADFRTDAEREECGRVLPRAEVARFAFLLVNLPVSTHVYELPAEQQRCSCCGEQRQEIGSEESWQVEYLPGHFERLRHVRKKYACASCERAGEPPQIEVAAKAETAIEKGFAVPGLLAYIVTSKFAGSCRR
jgi:hypothetical protein